MSNIDDKIVFEPTGFEYQNTKAKVVIVGITPGNSQLKGDRVLTCGRLNARMPSLVA